MSIISGTSPLSVFLNGVALLSEEPTLEGLLRRQGFDFDAAFACAVNGRFVPRTEWGQCPLQSWDRIDVVNPVTGG